MISNYEFIKTQAYEISWAVFRCAELFSQSKLKGEVEAAAVDLIADHAMKSDAITGDSPRIEKLVSLIRLAESVGQIAPVNANVLYRELDNLAKAIRLETSEQRKKENITASLEHIFTNKAYVENLSSSVIPIRQQAERDLQSGKTDSSIPQSIAPLGMTQRGSVNNSASQFGNIESLISAAVRPSQPIMEPSQKTPAVRQPLAPVSSAIVTPAVPIRPVSANTPAQVGSWQYVILQKVKDLGQTTTKELSTSFPEISERTIRFYLQKLVDSGAIDRIGSTGPGAAYKAK